MTRIPLQLELFFVSLHSSSYQGSNVESFSRKCGQHTAQAKDAKSSLSVDVRRSKLTSLRFCGFDLNIFDFL